MNEKKKTSSSQIFCSVIDSESRAIEERLRRKKRELHEYTDSGGFDVENYNNYDKVHNDYNNKCSQTR